ncbi:MAG: outer rane biosis protein BamB [Verrucomicrobiales bacterium]|nr:outer rane biosis protein BamB [Verrucomicrobiales bacterium]
MRALVFIFGLLLVCANVRAENWPCWRGERLDGTSVETSVPVHWSSTSNVAWKVELPGVGHASPVVWEDRIFTVTALEQNQERVLLCLDRKSGKILWQQIALKAPLEKIHQLNSHASSTPATDGKLVYVAFLDKNQMFVAAYDFTGKQVWAVRPGPFASMHGFCSSPILFKDKVIVNGDHDGDSYIVALSREDGRTLWKTPRKNHTRSYCVPLLRELAGQTQMVLSGDKSVASYNPNNGKLIWYMDGPTEQFVASVVYNEKAGLLFMTGGFPDHHILAIKPDGQGNITKSDKIVWRTNKGVSYVPSPISEGDYFLVVSDSGVAHCFAAKTGKIAWQERMGSHHASLVSAKGLVYFLNDDGVMNVVKPEENFERVAQNQLGEKTFASPAISQGQMFIRGDKHLFCIGEK